MMKHALLLVSLAALTAATPAAAQSAFDGNWKADVANAQFPDKPFVTTLINGQYTCDSCDKPYTVPADGAFHAVKDQPYVDEVAVQVVDPHTITFRSRKGGKETYVETDTVGPDGKSLTYKSTDSSAPNGQPVNETGEQVLVTPGPAGSHPVSGGWRMSKVANITDAALMMTINADASKMTAKWGDGETFSAAWGGPAVPIQGDLAGTTTAVEKVGDHGFRRTNTRNGKVVGVQTYMLSPDGKTLAVTAENKLQGTTTHYNFVRQ